MRYPLTLLSLWIICIAQAQNTLDNAGLGAGVNASVAYSIRRLSSAYTGKALQIRRSSDNATQDIGFTSSGDLDSVSLKSFVGAGSGYISKWYDQSGNAKDLTQSSAGNQPILVTSGTINRENTRPFIQFWGYPHVGYNALFLPAAMTTTGHVSSVMKFASGGYGFILSHSSVYNWHSDPGSWLFSTNSSLGSTSVKNGNAWSNGSLAAHPYNIVWPTVLTVEEAEPQTPNSGTDWDNIGSDRGSCCHVISGGGGYSELIVFSTALSTGNRQLLENNEMTYFGMVALPLEWLSFSSRIDRGEVLLQWQVTGQKDEQAYTIQHSTDGRSWNTIASLPVTADSYIHAAPRTGDNYYRIALTRLQGTPSYSPISKITLHTPANTEFRISQNPATGAILSVTVLTPVTLSIHSMDGKLLWKNHCAPGLQQINLDGYPKGYYVLHGQTSAEKFLVQ